ncbi:Molecular chaperone DnaK [Mycena venus]|uniref:Molecular chaperone DnaK n=1 Tax=Mycena venus TaxID=2733690 RepID=A0A8H6YJV3_9AGAR|nr:Molecular chaperone DnaK [Mycena venus]
MKDAALLAGLSPVRLLDQPVAIAMAYGLDRLETDSLAFVLDVGSSTRAALLHITNTDSKIVASARNVGGGAISKPLLDYAREAFRLAINDDIDDVQRMVLEDQVEQAKTKLSFEDLAVIALPIHDAPWFLVPVTAAELNTRTGELVEDIVNGTIEQVLRAAGVSIHAIDHAILAGGSSYIPAIRDRFARAFPSIIPLSTAERYPDDVVVHGASLFARRLALGMVPEESKIYVGNATPMRFGIEIAGGLFSTIIPRNSPLPARMTRRLTIPGRSIRVFTGAAEYTNATEFIGSVVLPPK